MVLAAVCLQIAIFWSMTPYSPVDSLHLQNKTLSQASYHEEGNTTRCLHLADWLVIFLAQSSSVKIRCRNVGKLRLDYMELHAICLQYQLYLSA